jgi:tRNA pseudouridine55 synthase
MDYQQNTQKNHKMLNQTSGVLVIDKPVGITSHDVVQAVRRGTGIRRAGHTGTLDPRASGVLVVLIGPAVRLSEFLTTSEKRYQAVMKFGMTTSTYDTEGAITSQGREYNFEFEDLEEALTKFVGEVEQTPPVYSALKIDGRRAYELARKGEEIEMEPRKITVHSLELLEWEAPEAVIDIHCSSGTYIRSLAHDLGEEMGSGATLINLRRTKNGRFTLRDSVSLRKLEEAFANGDWYRYLIPAAEALADWYTVELSFDQVDEVRHGHRVPALEPMEPGSLARAISQEGELVALVEYIEEDQEWQPRKVFMM